MGGGRKVAECSCSTQRRSSLDRAEAWERIDEKHVEGEGDDRVTGSTKIVLKHVL